MAGYLAHLYGTTAAAPAWLLDDIPPLLSDQGETWTELCVFLQQRAKTVEAQRHPPQRPTAAPEDLHLPVAGPAGEVVVWSKVGKTVLMVLCASGALYDGSRDAQGNVNQPLLDQLDGDEEEINVAPVWQPVLQQAWPLAKVRVGGRGIGVL